MRKKIVLFLCLLCSSTAFASDLKKLAWLQGCWSGSGLGGQVDECWIQDQSGKLTSVYQLQRNGKQIFSKIVTLDEFNGQIEMRVRHFNNHLEQWNSDKGLYQLFKLLTQEPHLLVFNGLTIELVNPNIIRVQLDFKEKNGSIRTEEYLLARRRH